MNFYQIGVFLLQGTLIALLILFLFRIRKQLGIGLLFACLGLFQFMQVFLSSTIYVSITESILVSPGSSVLFTASLFAILLIYIKEDSTETRKIIYALLITNTVLSVLLQTFRWSIEEPTIYNPFNVSTALFDNNARVLFIGTLVLFIDSILIIFIFESISKIVNNLFFRISITLVTVVIFDTLIFSISAFWNFEKLNTIIYSGLISKSFFAVFYSVFLYFYLKYIEKDIPETINFKVKDIFQTLSYRQKFEIAKKDRLIANEKAKLKEIKYQTLTRISPVGIFHTKSDGYTTFVNPKWCEISGISENEALGDGWLRAVHPDDVKTIHDNWNLAVSHKKDSDSEYRFVHSDGSIRWVLGQAVPELNSNNEITGFVGTITDITDIKNYQLEQNRLRLKAEESDKLKSAFLANMSHEIRTPMNGILGFAEVLKDPELTIEKQHHYLGIIEKSGIRLLNIINDIVDISKVEAGLMEVNLKESNINEQLMFVYDFFKPETERKNLRLILKKSVSVSNPIIITDREKIYAVLTNLVKNAINYTIEGSIIFGCEKVDNNLEFFVKDTGIGIPMHRQEAIFERFIQADISKKQAFQGAGLGLTISKAYIELLGGKMWLESEEGKGSTFYFSLPYSSVHKEINTTNVDSYLAETIKSTKNLKILIAEDDEACEELNSIVVEKYSKKTIIARHGIEAVEICRNNPDIDLILMDVQMPQLNGLEATRLIREFNKSVIIIAQTAYAQTGDRETALSAGCNDYISKPINISKLNLLIETYFENKLN